MKVCPDIFNIAWETFDFAHTNLSPVLNLDILKFWAWVLGKLAIPLPFS